MSTSEKQTVGSAQCAPASDEIAGWHYKVNPSDPWSYSDEKPDGEYAGLEPVYRRTPAGNVSERFKAIANGKEDLTPLEQAEIAAETNQYETTKAGVIDWKMEAERVNRLLAQALAQVEGMQRRLDRWEPKITSQSGGMQHTSTVGQPK